MMSLTKAGADNSSQRVKRYLTSHGVKEGLWLDPNGRHGQALLVGDKGINRVLDWIRNDPNDVKC